MARTRLQSAGVMALPTGAAVEFAQEPGARRSPGALHGGDRQARDFADLVDREPGEKAQFDDLTLARVQPGERFERVVERGEVQAALHGKVDRRVQGNGKGTAAAF